MAEWSCSGLQSRVRRFDSDLRLQSIDRRPDDEIGRRKGLKIPGRKACRFDSGSGHQKKTARKSVLFFWGREAQSSGLCGPKSKPLPCKAMAGGGAGFTARGTKKRQHAGAVRGYPASKFELTRGLGKLENVFVPNYNPTKGAEPLRP